MAWIWTVHFFFVSLSRLASLTQSLPDVNVVLSEGTTVEQRAFASNLHDLVTALRVRAEGLQEVIVDERYAFVIHTHTHTQKQKKN